MGWLLATLFSVFGCGDDGGGADASPDTSPPDSMVVPNDLPSLTPCPAGWQEVGGGEEPVVCEPWPTGGHAICAADEAQFPGESGCVRIGVPCPAGDFEEGLADDGTVIFVLEGASGGDGTRASPFGSVSDAIDVAVAGTTVALSKGTHEGAITIPDGVTVRGACVAETHLSDTSGAYAVVTLDGTDNAIENVSITAGEATGVYCEYLGGCRASDLAIQGASTTGDAQGLEHAGLSFEVRNVRVSTVFAGILLVLDEGSAAFTVDRIVIEDAGVGIYGYGLDADARFDLRDAVIRNTTVATIDLSIDLGTVAIERTILENGAFLGIAIFYGGSSSLTDIVIRDMSSDPAGLDGAGIGLDSISSGFAEPVVLRRVLIERVKDAGIYAFDSQLDAQGLVIRDVERQECTSCPSTAGAAGIAAESMAAVTVSDFYVADVAGCGVNVGESGQLDLSGGFVRRATVGACVHGEGFDIDRLTTDVEYSDNMSSLDSTGLPVPTIDGEGPIP